MSTVVVCRSSLVICLRLVEWLYLDDTKDKGLMTKDKAHHCETVRPFTKLQSPLPLILMLPIRLFATTRFAGYQRGNRGRSLLTISCAFPYRVFAVSRSVALTASSRILSSSGFE